MGLKPPFLLFFICCIILLPSPSLPNESNASFDMGFITGVRTDELNWSIAGNGTTPVNVLSELEFNNLDIYQRGICMKFSTFGFFFKPKILKGSIHQGESTDSDYAGNNRTELTSRSIMDVNSDDTTDVALTFGYNLNFPNEHLSISPLIGYSNKDQNFVMTNGSLVYPEKRPIIDLNSKYSATWESLFTGLTGSYSLPIGINIDASFKYHDLEYEAAANWNLRHDFAHPVSFRHFGDGYGAELGCGIGYQITNWQFNLSYRYSEFKINDGRDELYLSSGYTAKSQLNEVEWQSEAINIEVGYTFE